jgi:hypothetical protein
MTRKWNLPCTACRAGANDIDQRPVLANLEATAKMNRRIRQTRFSYENDHGKANRI